MITEMKQQFASDLFEIGAIRFGAFRLKLHETHPDAPLSPIYIDLRILRSFPRVVTSAVDVYQELASQLEFDIYADVPTAATPLVAVLSSKTGIPMITPRKDKKSHGVKRPIDGVFKTGQVVLLVDDLITRAESKLEAISALEENGLRVRDVAVLIDREQGGVKQLMQKGYRCHAALKLRDLLGFYKNSNKITSNQYELVMDYLNEDQNKK